ncbi:MAG TPA: DUF429 domain-containing protein [Dehalococcoidia bacterium]|nr:DUF429 domain-containing protein [Dehalococcoidia bacterium]
MSARPKGNYWGLDLTSSQARPSACVGLDDDLDLTFLGFLASDADIMAEAQAHHPTILAIDAPLTLPLGLCCLEESCACQPLSGTKGRGCERELVRLGIPCYFTTKRSIIKRMVYRAIGLGRELACLGVTVIEVYPYATKVCLWGRPIPQKTKAEGLVFLRERLAGLVPALRPYLDRLGHDLCDAALAAYTAFLYSRSRTRAIGDEAGVIHIPEERLDTSGRHR